MNVVFLVVQTAERKSAGPHATGVGVGLGIGGHPAGGHIVGVGVASGSGVAVAVGAALANGPLGTSVSLNPIAWPKTG